MLINLMKFSIMEKYGIGKNLNKILKTNGILSMIWIKKLINKLLINLQMHGKR